MNELSGHPGESVSSLAFSPVNKDELLVSSWDGTVRVYDADRDLAKQTIAFDAPVLDCCYDSYGQNAFAGGLDQGVSAINMDRGLRSVIAPNCHTQAVSCLSFNNEHSTLFSGSWDGSIVSIDLRVQTQSASTNTVQLEGGSKVFSMATVASSLIVATSTKRLLIYDARYLATPVEDRESPLKGQIRAVEIHPNGASFCVGSTEGRVAIEYLDMKDAALQQKKYAFKCHRQGEKGELLFPVNALAYNPVFGTFASGGSDGQVLTWDFMNKKKLKTLSPSGPLGTPVAAMAFSCDGSMLAIAASHTFESDMTGEDKNNQIYIYRPSEAEVAPKKKK